MTGSFQKFHYCLCAISLRFFLIVISSKSEKSEFLLGPADRDFGDAADLVPRALRAIDLMRGAESLPPVVVAVDPRAGPRSPCFSGMVPSGW